MLEEELGGFYLGVVAVVIMILEVLIEKSKILLTVLNSNVCKFVFNHPVVFHFC